MKTNCLVRIPAATGHSLPGLGLFYLLTFAFCSGLAGSLQAQQNPYPFNYAYLNKEDGLPHNICYTGKRDRRGFLWVGTQDGLARYDGIHFKVYGQAPDSTGLSAATVTDIDEDAAGYLWIATSGGGLNRFDPATETFRWYRHDPNDPSSLPGDDLTHLLIDEDGSVWVGAMNTGFSRLDPRTGRFRHFRLVEAASTPDPGPNPKNSVYDIASDPADPELLWLADEEGIYRFTKKTGALEHFVAPSPFGAGIVCRDVQCDQPDFLWIATEGGGIARLWKKSRRWEFFPPLPGEWARRNLSANLIYDISRKSAHELWVASPNLGFGIFDFDNGRYNWFESLPKPPPGQSGQSVNGLYGDPAGLLWIFNYKSGISVLDPARNVFEYTPLPADGCANPQLNVPNDFAWNSQRQELYVVTGGCRGFYVLKPQQRTAPVQMSGQSPYRLEFSLPPATAPADRNFRCVLVDSRRRVWVGAGRSKDHGAPGFANPNGGTLYEYRPGERSCRPFRHRLLKRIPLHQYTINALAEDARGRLWLATEQGGLIAIDFRRDTMVQYLSGGDFDGTHTVLTDLQFDPSGRLWLATEEHGVFSFSPETGTFVHFGAGTKQGLAENRCTALAIDAEGNVWVGTGARGLQKIPAGAAPGDVFPRFTTLDGLAFNNLHGLAWTPEGKLWIATEKGISCYPGARSLFANYDESDGLADTYLSGKGFRYCANGEIFIGQPKGFYSITPDSIYNNSIPPKLAFTGFRLLGQVYPTGKDLNFQPEVRLRHDQNFFTIQFAALNFSQAEHNNYWYQLEGIDPDWVKNDNKSEATYTKVTPGRYVFRVRAENNSGVASAGDLSMVVDIVPAFYQTATFKAFVFLVLAAILIAFIRFRLDVALRQEAAKSELNRLRAVKAESETKALRSQMNPHFIFNAMNTIEALIVEEKVDEASALLQKFSKLVRAVLENSQHDRVPIGTELDALDLYLQLEAVRMDGRFQHRIEVDEKIDRNRHLIPPLILQPFAENAILHGLRHKPGSDGLLIVRLRDQNGFLICQIEDNGIGRAKSAELNERNRLKVKKQSLGIKLTTERIELLNAPGRKDCRVEFTDLDHEGATGTIATLILPLARLSQFG